MGFVLAGNALLVLYILLQIFRKVRRRQQSLG